MTTTNYKQLSFLVVDDFDKFRTVVKSTIQQCGGSQIDLAINASDALYRIKNTPYDVILCDYHLGDGKNGQQLLEQLRHESLITPVTVFIMVTAESSAEMVLGAIECQPDGYLMKPFNQAMLRSRLNKALQLKKRIAPIYSALDDEDTDLAIQQCKAIAKEHPKYTAQCKQIEAELYVNTEQYDQAKAIYTAILRVRSFPWAKLGLGQVHYLTENYQEAIKVLKELIEESRTTLQAYDWLAKAQMALGKDIDAEQTLKRAIEISPQAILRQMELGKIAYELGDFETAEESYRSATKIGKHSCYKTPDNYTNLARSLKPKLESENESIRRRASDETFKTLKDVKQEYKDDKNIALEATLLESQSHKVLNNEREAERALEYAEKLYENYADSLSPELKVDMAKTCRDLGHHEKAEAIAQELAADCNDETLTDQLGTLIETSPLNAEGMALYKEGDFAGAVVKFEEALKEYPSSFSINLNAIQAMVRLMQENSITEELVSRCESLWEKVEGIPDSDKRYQRFVELKKLYGSVIKNKA